MVWRLFAHDVTNGPCAYFPFFSSDLLIAVSTAGEEAPPRLPSASDGLSIRSSSTCFEPYFSRVSESGGQVVCVLGGSSLLCKYFTLSKTGRPDQRRGF